MKFDEVEKLKDNFVGRRAIIFGISGQDGAYLSEYLLSLGYEVHGVVRRNSTPEHQESRLSHLGDKIHTYYGDVTDRISIDTVMRTVMPDEIYEIAAQSHVRVSFDVPEYTAQTNAIGILNVLESYRTICPNARYYTAASSEMFGNSVDGDGFQRITTPMQPVSPYGIAKLFAYHMTKHYRRAYNLHACNGILFNHESPLRRGSNFATTKIAKAACMIKLGLQDKLEMGNLDSYRDWGFSGNYVKAMHLIINQITPNDWVVATGETHSVREFCEIAFGKLGLDYKDYVTQNPKFMRPEELKYLKGDSTPIREQLGWYPEHNFDWLVSNMVSEWYKLLQEKYKL